MSGNTGDKEHATPGCEIREQHTRRICYKVLVGWYMDIHSAQHQMNHSSSNETTTIRSTYSDNDDDDDDMASGWRPRGRRTERGHDCKCILCPNEIARHLLGLDWNRPVQEHRTRTYVQRGGLGGTFVIVL